jgi:thermostable hemolysin
MHRSTSLETEASGEKCMNDRVILEENSPLRNEAEKFIKDTYYTRYRADIPPIKSRIMAVVDRSEQILCAAGLREAQDGFFSESYLQAPIETVLSIASNSRVDRNEIFEVTTLASRAPSAIAELIGEIVAFGETSGFSWSFFTLTSSLSRMVGRLGFEPICLATADRRRVPNFERWGDYYETRPKVFAVSRTHFDRQRSFNNRVEAHAPRL